MCKVKVVSGIACHGGVGAFYVLPFSGVNKDHFHASFSFLIDSRERICKNIVFSWSVYEIEIVRSEVHCPSGQSVREIGLGQEV